MRQNFNPQHVSSASAWQYFHRLLTKRLKKLEKNIKRLEKNPRRHSIHQLRVLSRRLRAMFSVLKQGPEKIHLKPAAKSVKNLTKLLSPIRSLDVSFDLLKAKLKKFPAQGRRRIIGCEAALGELRRNLRAALPQASRNLGAKLRPTHAAKLFRAGDGTWFLGSLRRQVRAAAGKAAKALAVYQAKPDIPKLHEFRIGLKKYRYLLEIRGEILNAPYPRLEAMKAMQDEIGAIHDLEVLKQLLKNPSVNRRLGEHGNQKELQSFVSRLESEIAGRERKFLPRRRRLLKSLFTEKAL